jgi:hypothetical protein
VARQKITLASGTLRNNLPIDEELNQEDGSEPEPPDAG